MPIKENTQLSLKLVIPIVGLAFWVGTTYMLVINVSERQATMEAKLERYVDQQQIRDRAINDKLGDVKTDVSVINGNIELLLRRSDKIQRK